MIFIFTALALLNIWGFYKAVRATTKLEGISRKGKADIIGWNVLDIFLTLAMIGFFIVGYALAGFLTMFLVIGLLFAMPVITVKIMNEEKITAA